MWEGWLNLGQSQFAEMGGGSNAVGGRVLAYVRISQVVRPRCCNVMGVEVAEPSWM